MWCEVPSGSLTDKREKGGELNDEQRVTEMNKSQTIIHLETQRRDWAANAFF